VLRACRQVLRPGGRLAFITIQPTPSLGEADRRRAHRRGPFAVSLPTSYQSLLRTAGFTEIVATDVTGAYRATQQRWIDTYERHADALREVVGHETFNDRSVSRRQTLEALDNGLLSRFLYTAAR
jgi:cyclopropane fatty-acyl-phospholipid synthase-like methyltransferase